MNYIEFYYNRDKYKGEDSSDFLSHYGILGQKWGQRRWQNSDGTFNEAGKERYFGTGKFQKVEKTEDKIGGMKKNGNGEKYNPKYQYPWGGLKEKGKELLEKNPKKFSKKVNSELYESDKKYNEDVNKNKENNKKILEKNIELLNEIGKKYGFLEEGDKEINNNKEGKIILMTPTIKKMFNEFEHEFYEVPETNNKLKEYTKDEIEKDIQKYNDFSKKFNDVYDKAIDETAKLSYESYVKKVENPVSFDEFKNNIKISPFIDEKHVYLNDNDFNVFLKMDLDNAPKVLNLVSDLNGNVKVLNSFDMNYRDINYKDNEENQNDQKIGSTNSKKINWLKIDKDNQEPNFDENRYWKNKEKAEKYLDKNYDRIFAETIKDDYDTGGEWGDVDSRYKQYKENPYKFMKDNGRRWIWDYINEAVDKLGLGNVKKLSSSDWDKINAEINAEIKELKN